MFLLVCLISGPAGAGSGEDSPSYVLQVHKVTRVEDGHNFITDFCFSVTSRRGVSTSRRQFYLLLSRRDVDLPRRDVNFNLLCHVATCIFTSRRVFSRRDMNLYKPLSRRDVVPHVATSFNHILFHVATLSRTSQRWLSYSLSRRDVTSHVATWPCFKPKISSFLAFHLTHSKSIP